MDLQCLISEVPSLAGYPQWARTTLVDLDTGIIYVPMALAEEDGVVTEQGVLFRAVMEEQIVIGMYGHNYVQANWLAVAYPKTLAACQNLHRQIVEMVEDESGPVEKEDGNGGRILSVAIVVALVIMASAYLAAWMWGGQP